ncbi:MAG: hypothetical protein CMJ58_12820 [Planctomycetaceae bacterium]|nr:hypothetical protein [Planctomycetaceae bacterium]
MTKIKALVLGGLVLTIISVIGVQHLRLGIAQNRADTAEAALASCNRDRMTLVESIKDQNAAIAEMKAQADAQAERLAVAAQDAAEARRDAEVRVRRIMAEEVPQECAAAVRWGAEQGAKLAERWM